MLTNNTGTATTNSEIFGHGETRVVGGWQIKAVGWCLSITDVRNAGKPGKTCAHFEIDAWHHRDTAGTVVLARDVAIFAESSPTDEEMAAKLPQFIKTVGQRAARCDDFASKASLARNGLRGVDVALPAVKVETGALYLRADGIAGSISDRSTRDGSTYYINGKASCKKFYAWALARVEEIQTMTFVQAKTAIESLRLDVRYCSSND
jgi:hypothetical protein